MSLRGGEDYNRAHDLQSGDRVGGACCAVRPVRVPLDRIDRYTVRALHYFGATFSAATAASMMLSSGAYTVEKRRLKSALVSFLLLIGSGGPKATGWRMILWIEIGGAGRPP